MGFDYPAVAKLFWPRVIIGGGCWPWEGAHTPKGYGVATVAGRAQRAHRVAWALWHGSWPDSLVLHRCGNQGCVRPDHLYTGDSKQNRADARDQGTLPFGERSPNAKVTDAQVELIRQRYAGGEIQRSIAADYGITQAQVSNIVRGYQRNGTPLINLHHLARYTVTCAYCAEEFRRVPGERIPRFCSHKCRSLAQRTGEPKTCPVCGIEFYRSPAQNVRTCSLSCRDAAKRAAAP